MQVASEKTVVGVRFVFGFSGILVKVVFFQDQPTNKKHMVKKGRGFEGNVDFFVVFLHIFMGIVVFFTKVGPEPIVINGVT